VAVAASFANQLAPGGGLDHIASLSDHLPIAVVVGALGTRIHRMRHGQFQGLNQARSTHP
jgi:hypothetical protein